MPKGKAARTIKRKKAAPARPAAAPGPSSAQDKSLRDHVVSLLRGGHAHTDFDKTIADFPSGLQSTKPAGLPYSAWQLLEHLRIAQWDIVEFSRNPKHVSPEFPAGYWPDSEAPPTPKAWSDSVAAFRRGLKKMEKLVLDRHIDLHAHIGHGTGQTVLREALLLADHNAYHLGQMLVLRRLLGAWKD